MSKKTQIQENTKKKWSFNYITKVIIFPLIFFLIFAGTIFGMVDILIKSDNLQQGDEFKNQYQIELHVDNLRPDEGKDIYYVSDYYTTQLNNLGLQSSKVSVIDQNDLMVTFPLTSLSNNKKDEFSYDNLDNFFRELVMVEGTLLNTANIEFRSYTGDLLFNYDETGDKVIFYPPITPDTGTGETTTPAKTEITPKSVQPYETYDISLIESADVKYINGNPYVEIHPYDEFLYLFDDAINQMYTLYDQTTNPYGNFYSVWFSYSLFDFLASTFDQTAYVEAEQMISQSTTAATFSNLYAYVYYDTTTKSQRSTPIPVSKPFYITSGKIQQAPSKYDNSYGIYGDFSVNDANAIANKINFSTNHFNITVVSQQFVINNNNFLTLKIFFILFFIFILAVSFFFVWWFGLLGAIVIISSLIPGLIIVYLITLFSISIGFILFASIIMAYLVIIMLQYQVLNIYVNKSVSTNTKLNTKFIENVKLFSKNTMGYLFILITPFAIASLFLPIILQYYILIFVFSVALMYLCAYILWFPLLYIFDMFFMFTFRENKENENKWNYLYGMNDEKLFAEGLNLLKFNKLDNKNESKSIKILFVSFLIIIFVGIGMFSIFAETMGGVNKILPNSSYYQYNVVRNIPLSKNDGFGDDIENDPYDQQELINEAERNSNQIISIFEENGIKVEKTQIIRDDSFQIIENNDINETYPSKYLIDYQFAYGISIYSYDSMDLAAFDAISNSLAEIKDTSVVTYIPYGQVVPVESYEFNYILLENASLSNFSETNEALIISNQNFNNNISGNIIALVILFVLAFIIISLIYNWSIALSAFITISFEILTATAVMVILFVPFSIAFIIALVSVIWISIFSKLLITQREDNKYKFVISNTIISNIFLSFLFLINILVSFTLGINVLISLLLLFVFSMILNFSNIFMFPYLSKVIINWRNDWKHKTRIKDEEWAKNLDNISEEYIEGINK